MFQDSSDLTMCPFVLDFGRIDVRFVSLLNKIKMYTKSMFSYRFYIKICISVIFGTQVV